MKRKLQTSPSLAIPAILAILLGIPATVSADEREFPGKVMTLAAVALWSPVLADERAGKDDGKAPLMVSFADLKWTELPERKGMQFAVLSGDPKKGEYTQMRKVPRGTDNPLHAHTSELKNVIISGVWYTGANVASARDFGPGSIVMMPANWGHVSGCRAGSDCVFYQEGKGKFDFKPAAKGPAQQVGGMLGNIQRPASR